MDSIRQLQDKKTQPFGTSNIIKLTTWKRQIKIIAGLLILFSFSGFAYSQNTKVTATANVKSDSADLKALVVKLLKWHEKDNNMDFEPLLKNPKDTIYTGIDWQAHKKRVTELEKTNLFTKSFLDNYQQIALHLDKELKQNKTKYIVGELPPFGSDANEWCDCQDYPSNYLKRLKILALKINNNSATFKWTWGDDFFYSIKAQKENNIWRIAEMERFNIKNFSW
jgi:hypothetical protein